MKHRAWVEVDLEQLRQNLRNLVQLVRPAQVAAVVKSEAYGHGLLPVALALEQEEIWGVCVVHPEEGVRLRQAGFGKPILVVGASFPEEMGEAIAHDVTLAVYDVEQARQVSAAAENLQRTAKVHLKFDTGLSRLALPTTEARDFYRQVEALPNLDIEGAYSHLADAEGLDQTFTLKQYRNFKNCLDELRTDGFEPNLRHIGASAAAMLLEHSRLDLVRVGISLYGYWPSPETKILHYGANNDLNKRLQDEFLDRATPNIQPLFKPVLAYRARVIQTKWIECRAKVGYGCTYETQRRTRIAILPVGYAEGYDRHLSNCGEVLLEGRRARVLGRVCMNLTVVDVTDIPEAQKDSVATLWGPAADGHITVEEVASKIGTINYEVVTRIPASIPRVYLDFSKA
jgi:alanine racemase